MLSAMQSLHLVIVILYLSRSVVSSQPFQVSTSLSGIPSTQPVRVSCVFDNTWLAATHPMDYPSSNAHWSPMVVVSHSGDYEMWAPSQLASPGVQSVAEVGQLSFGARGIGICKAYLTTFTPFTSIIRLEVHLH